MLTEIHREQTIPYKYIVADSIYGHSPAFIEEVEKLDGKIYMVSITADTQCWLKTPVTMVKKYKYKGEKRSKTVLEDPAKNPVTVHQIASNLNNYFWYRRKVSEGTKGPIEYEFSKRRVMLSKDGLPWKTVWLIMRRTIEKTPTYSFFISNAPENTRLSTFVWLSGIRWAIEQCFEEGKTELGMDHYEVRKYPGWNHHMLMVMLSHFFLRPKRLKPVVGFCGYPGRQKKQSISRKIKQRIKGAVKGIPFSNTGPIVRARSLQHLSESPLVETNFVIRDRFMGGASLPDGTPNFPAMQELRQEYVHDMMNSDYILCARGGGNFSYRLYETLCCGRIPVFIDTNCVLPYESEINWHDYCVWIDEKQIDSIGKRVADFHNRLTVEAFTELQQKCRMLWEDWLSPEGFFGNFYRNFSEISNVY